MPAKPKDNSRRLTGYNTGAGPADHQPQQHQHQHQPRGRIQHQSLYDDDMDDYEAYSPGDDAYDDDDDDDDEEDHDSEGSVLSIPDPNIDFDLVYALHTFAATVEGQASVVKGDALTLLDDSNSYWWLVKVLKTSEVGYIPAENIETPYERLARLNSHRNIELTQRDIQDAFPAPPSAKPNKVKKKVTLAKGVQFQSQIIIGASDDEEFEEEYSMWHETIRSDSELDTTDSDDDDYYDDIHMYGSYHMDPSQPSITHTHAAPVAPVAPAPVYESTSAGPVDAPSPSPTPPERRNMPFRDTLDLEQSETIKISLTPSIARDSDEQAYGDYQMSKAEKLEKLLREDDPQPQKQRRGSKEKKEKTGLRKLFSRNKDKDKKQRKGSTQSVTETVDTASVSSQSTGYSDRDRAGSIDSTHLQVSEPVQPAMLKIYAGNLFFDAEYKVTHAYPSTTTAELIQQAVDSFDIRGHRPTADVCADYALTVKGIDGDEYTLVPLDRPLAIYHSLTDHLNTPMPSLKKARRISALMAANEGARMGGPKEDSEHADEVRFYLHSKTRRSEESQVPIKVSLFAAEVGGYTSMLRPDQTRVDKSVSVPIHATVLDVTTLLLEKFHILNGIAYASEVDEHTLRLHGGEAIRYQLCVSRQGQEQPLDPAVRISSAFGDILPPVQHRRSSNPDRSSVASISSVINTPLPDETFFVLRRLQSQPPPQTAAERPVRPPRPVRHDTPMPRLSDTPSPVPPSDTVPTMHPLENHQQQQPEQQLEQQQLTEEPESAVDVLLRLDEALDSLAHTRNSNEPLTEAITHQMESQQNQQRQITRSPESGESQQIPILRTPEPDAFIPPETPQPQASKPRQQSMLFCDDFGMKDLMILIRGAARYAEETEKHSGHKRSSSIRSEISQIYREDQQRLEQLEKELDRLMADAVQVYQ